MNKIEASKIIMDLFIMVVNKYNYLGKIPTRINNNHNLYHSERHMLDQIGDTPGMNITEFAKKIGVTKGAVSQVVKKLEDKGVVSRYKSSNNDKEVFVELTPCGRDIYINHKIVNEETLKPLTEELNKHSDDKIEFLIFMFKWLGDFLDMEEKHMKDHSR